MKIDPTLPVKVKSRAADVLASLNETPFRRINKDHTLAVVDLGYRYRLVCRIIDGRLVPKEIVHHSKYSSRIL